MLSRHPVLFKLCVKKGRDGELLGKVREDREKRIYNS
jgi:hypothetical protein